MWWIRKKWSEKQIENIIISNKLVFHASITPCLELVEGLPLKKCFPHIKWFFDGIQFEPSLFFRSIAFVHVLVSVASFLLALKMKETVEWVEKTRKSVLQIAHTSHRFYSKYFKISMFKKKNQILIIDSWPSASLASKWLIKNVIYLSIFNLDNMVETEERFCTDV